MNIEVLKAWERYSMILLVTFDWNSGQAFLATLSRTYRHCGHRRLSLPARSWTHTYLNLEKGILSFYWWISIEILLPLHGNFAIFIGDVFLSIEHWSQQRVILTLAWASWYCDPRRLSLLTRSWTCRYWVRPAHVKNTTERPLNSLCGSRLNVIKSTIQQ